MTTINLKDFYPWYTHDEYIEVSEEVADELRASRLYEAAYQRLWRTFFDAAAIEARRNPACQRTHLPLKYRRYMTEFQD